MDEPQEQITDPNMVDIRTESVESAISPIQAPRASTMVESEEEDSRTAVAGRKRGFQEAAHPEDTVDINISDDDEPSRKRAKENEPSSIARAEDTLVTNITSVSPVPVPAEEEADVSHLPSAQSSSDSDHARVADDQAQSAPGKTIKMSQDLQDNGEGSFKATSAWNAGVQGGLRTSFGRNTSISNAAHEQREGKRDRRKARKEVNRQALLAHTAQLENVGNDVEERTHQAFSPLNEQPMNDGTFNMEDSTAQPPRPSTLTFKQLSSDEIGRLSAIDRIRYWNAHFDHQKAHGVPPQAQVQSFSTAEPSASGANALQSGEATSESALALADASDGGDPDESESENDQDDSDGDEDEDDIPRDTNKIQTQDSQIPSVTDAQLLAFGPPPTPPAHFQKLGKGQKKKMSKAERGAYRSRAAAYNDALNRYRTAKREYDAKLGNSHPAPSLPSNFENKPTRLTKREVSELTKADQDKYAKIMGAEQLERKRARMDKYHKEAEAVLQQVKQWPLPPLSQQKNQSVSANIRKGKTWYASHRSDKNGVRPFKSNGCTFQMAEIFDVDGLPLPIQQFSFNTFVPVFIKNNEADWNKMNQGILKSAFNQYMFTFYVHALQFEPWVKSTANAPDAILLKDAIRQANNKLGMSHSSTNSLPTPRPAKPLASGPVKQEAIPLDSAIYTEGRIQEDLPNVKEEGAVNPQEQDPDTVMTAAVSTLGVTVNTPTPTFESIEDPDLRKTLIFLQQKYYPSSSTAIRCLSCAKVGHMTDTCPALNCMTCGAQGKHSTLMCPRDMPCEKCRGHSHTRQHCPEKLSLPASEMTCDLCGSRNHLETDCHNIWRSFDPSSNEIIVVSGIPIYCYTCGNSGHYGPDCGLFQGQKILSGGYTFSESNLMRYSDSKSRDRAISAGKDYSIPPRPSNTSNYSIKGKGKESDPITFDESEEDEKFLRPSVRSGNVPRGPIRFGNGQPPQAPLRSGPSGQGDMTMTMRGPGPQGGGGGKKNPGGGAQGNQNKRARGAPGRRPKTRVAAINSGLARR